MNASAPLVYKIATEPWELEQVHRLNYRTFVEEIPQHKAVASGRLVDKFHGENTYVICLQGRRLLGMLAVRASRPFSLDEKLENLDSYLPLGRSVCEIRLLSVEKNHRGGYIFYGLMAKMAEFSKEKGYNLAVISGTVSQLKLYEHIGFVPFGPLVGTEEAPYQPMYLKLESFEDRRKRLPGTADPWDGSQPINLLSGPVGIDHQIRQSFCEMPVSHRLESFVEDLLDTKRRLCRLTHARYVEIMMGSATLANDAIGAQISLMEGRGLILSSGEFGERLIDHATRFRLDFDTMQLDWGQTFDRETIEEKLNAGPNIRWLWEVHCETSTGVLSDLPMLKSVCRERGIRLCLDCVSAIGAVPVDLEGVHLASGTSGKALGAYPGLAMVFYNEPLSPQPERLPRILDLGYYAANQGVPFTISSNLLYAMRTALKRYETDEPFESVAAFSLWLRAKIRELGLHVVAPDEHASPAVVTIELPPEIDSEVVGDQARAAGFLLGYQSRYLIQRNWIQVCFMGAFSRKGAQRFLGFLKKITGSPAPAAAPREASLAHV